MTYEEYINHHMKDHKTVPCDEGCGEYISITTVDSHFEACPRVIISCEKCQNRLFRDELEGHV